MIVRLNGGLGNQMFQAAFGYSVSYLRNTPVFFHKVGLDSGPRAYSLGAFNVPVHFAEPGDNPVYQEKTFAYDVDAAYADSSSYFIGNWQTEQYFKTDLVRNLFKLKNPVTPKTEEVATTISKYVSVSVHVRRTDYLVPNVAAYHGNMGVDYYTKAIEYVRSRVSYARFFFFSDDIEWCKQTFTDSDFNFVDHNGMGNGVTGPSTEHEDIYLMSRCDHAIIPNSSFGWWGAWLNSNKSRIVVVPKDWFVVGGPAGHLDTKDIVPERWVKI